MSEKNAKSVMASEWRRERAELLETIKRQQEDAERLANRFKLLQRALVDQQKLLDRYQQALQQSGALAKPNEGDGVVSKGSNSSTAAASTDKESAAITATAVAGGTLATSPVKSTLRTPGFNEHRALTAANTARNATSSLLIPPGQVTQDTEEIASAATASMSASAKASNKRKSSDAIDRGERHLSSVKREVEDATEASDTRRATKRGTPTGESTASTTKSKKRFAVSAAPTPTALYQKPALPASNVTTISRNAKPSSDVTPPSTSSSKGDSSASWIPRKADFHHQAVPVKVHSDVKPELSTPTVPSANSSSHEKAPAVVVNVKKSTSNPISSNTEKRSLNERAPTWAQEKLRMQEAGIIIKTGKRRFSDLKPPSSTVAAEATSAAAAAAAAKSDTSSQSDDKKENAFQYVEVVRNREARAALPGHDCVECRKYYEALDGLIPDAEMQLAKAKCSRHRARFEPYNTPDDFWRLSFPDSESQPLSP